MRRHGAQQLPIGAVKGAIQTEAPRRHDDGQFPHTEDSQEGRGRCEHRGRTRHAPRPCGRASVCDPVFLRSTLAVAVGGGWWVKMPH